MDAKPCTEREAALMLIVAQAQCCAAFEGLGIKAPEARRRIDDALRHIGRAIRLLGPEPKEAK